MNAPAKNITFACLLLLIISGCASKYVTTTGQEIVLAEHESLFLKNCRKNLWWDNHPPAANCGFFGKDILKTDPVGGLSYLKLGCDRGDDLSCLEFASNAYKLSTEDKRQKLIRSYKLPMEEITKARSYSLDLCLNRKIILNGADNSRWLCYFSGKLNSDVEPKDIPAASKSFQENCDKRGDCEELKKLQTAK